VTHTSLARSDAAVLPARFRWPEASRSACMFTFDLDAESVILALNAGYASMPSLMSHSAYEPLVAVPRILEILRHHSVTATFFVTGLTADLYPDVVRRIAAGGHEVAWHSQEHKRPPAMTREYHRRDLERGVETIERLTGTRPDGYRAPQFDQSLDVLDLLPELGYRYDSSLLEDDVPYLIETASGTLVQLPLHSSLSDWGQFGFISLTDEDMGDALETPRKLHEIWTGEFDAMREEGCLTIFTAHPLLSGRPARARTLEAVICHVKAAGDAWIATGREVAGYAQEVIPASDTRRVCSALDPQYAQRMATSRA
jgi:peptidoglycan-N-acetylglucosamine deacetylase